MRKKKLLKSKLNILTKYLFGGLYGHFVQFFITYKTKKKVKKSLVLIEIFNKQKMCSGLGIVYL